MTKPLLAPAIVLVLWSMIMLAWLVVKRLPALRAGGIDVTKVVGGTGSDLNAILDARVMWPAHNYAHLMEQPTLFYATIAALAILGAGTSLNVSLAWAYVILRIGHSLIQATYNKVVHRFPLFGLSSAVLVWLAINALLVALKP
jgi:hypothetical protein